MRKYLSFSLWLPVLLLGIALLFTLPTMKESANKGIPQPQSINWQVLVGEICLGLGSLATIVRGIAELVKLLLPKKRPKR